MTTPRWRVVRLLGEVRPAPAAQGPVRARRVEPGRTVARGADVVVVVPVLDPLPHVAGEVAGALVRVAVGFAAHGGRVFVAAAGHGLGHHGALAGGRLVAPGKLAIAAAGARGELPLGLRGQARATADPVGEGLGLVPVHTVDGVLLAPRDLVVAPGEVRGVRTRAGLHAGRILGRGDLGRGDLEARDRYGVLRSLLGGRVFGPHGEAAAGHAHPGKLRGRRRVVDPRPGVPGAGVAGGQPRVAVGVAAGAIVATARGEADAHTQKKSRFQSHAHAPVESPAESARGRSVTDPRHFARLS
jgi:hypothetical protein